MIVVRLDSPVPLIEQVTACIRAAIARAEVSPGDHLPPVRQLASDLGIDLNTVSRAYRALATSGLVRTQRGRGTQVTSDRDKAPIEALQIRERLRSALADARLAGYDTETARSLVEEELQAMWQEPNPKS